MGRSQLGWRHPCPSRHCYRSHIFLIKMTRFQPEAALACERHWVFSRGLANPPGPWQQRSVLGWEGRKEEVRGFDLWNWQMPCNCFWSNHCFLVCVCASVLERGLDLPRISECSGRRDSFPGSSHLPLLKCFQVGTLHKSLVKADNPELSDPCQEVSGLTPEGLSKAEPLDRVLQQVRTNQGSWGLILGARFNWCHKANRLDFAFCFEITAVSEPATPRNWPPGETWASCNWTFGETKQTEELNNGLCTM